MSARRDRRPRVLLVAGPAAGGTRTHVLNLARFLAGRGDEVTLLAPVPTFGDDRPESVTCLEAPVGSGAQSRRVRALLAAAGRSHDVVHAHGLRASAAAVTAVDGVPVVSTWHNAGLSGWPRSWLHSRLERVVAARAATVLTVSPDLYESALSHRAARVELIQVPAPLLAPTGVPVDRVRRDLGVPPGRPLVVATARLDRQKRLDLLVAAAASWTSAVDPYVVIAGDGPERRALERRIVRSRAPVRLVGRRRDIGDLLRAAEVAVITSRWEGWPLAAQEALRAGVPLVASDLPGIRALAGPAAEYVPVGDTLGFRRAIERAARDQGLRRMLKDAAQEREHAWLTVEQANDRIRTLYLNLNSTVKSR